MTSFNSVSEASFGLAKQRNPLMTSFKGNSYGYALAKGKKKRCIWFNSAFCDDFTLIDGKITDISFNVPPFQIYNPNNLKVICYIRDDENTKPILIKLKEPYLTNRSIINSDKDAYPIIYCNHTGVEGMTSISPKFTLIPQQIPRFVFRVDENFTPILSASSGVAIYQIFTYTGTIQTFTVPTGVNLINVYCWGAGGASGLNTRSYAIDGRGGSGGFVKATLTIPNGTTSFKVIVGQGGRKANDGTAFGGGGIGSTDGGLWIMGGGGGLSGIFVDNANMTMNGNNINSSANPIIIAGAGGGGGAQELNGTNYNDGGNGGSTTGNDGSGGTYGTGGTPTAGGTTGGALFTGGSASSQYQTGGGGGYYGGGRSSASGGTVGGGGGGSSYLNTGSYTITNITNIKNTTNGTATAPGNTESYYQSGIAIGGITSGKTAGTSNKDGGNGLVVIEYFVKRNEGLTAVNSKPPSFMIGLELEDTNLTKDNIASIYSAVPPTSRVQRTASNG